MKIYILLMLLALQFNVLSQIGDSTYIQKIKAYQKELNDQYKDKSHSPLTKKDRRKFKKHAFYKINKNYLVKAKFKRTPLEKEFKMKTTTDRLPVYRKYAIVYFKLNDEEYQLSVYQSSSSLNSEKYKHHLFLLFNDKTNGHGSYYGGRYIDLLIPEGDTIDIDFNKSYNPYCHYNNKYSCPIPPSENYLDIKVEAGIKSYSKGKKK